MSQHYRRSTDRPTTLTGKLNVWAFQNLLKVMTFLIAFVLSMCGFTLHFVLNHYDEKIAAMEIARTNQWREIGQLKSDVVRLEERVDALRDRRPR